MKVTILIMSFCIICTADAAERRRITVDQAEALAVVAATVKGEVRPDSVSSDEKINSGKLVNFEIFYPDSNGSSLYTVNLDTGDVFKSPGLEGDCALFPNERLREVRTKELKMVQEKVRHTINLTWAAYQKLRVKRPRCRDR